MFLIFFLPLNNLYCAQIRKRAPRILCAKENTLERAHEYRKGPCKNRGRATC